MYSSKDTLYRHMRHITLTYEISLQNRHEIPQKLDMAHWEKKTVEWKKYCSIQTNAALAGGETNITLKQLYIWLASEMTESGIQTISMLNWNSWRLCWQHFYLVEQSAYSFSAPNNSTNCYIFSGNRCNCQCEKIMCSGN